MTLLVVLAIVAALILWAVSVYNRLVAQRNDTENAWRQIDVQLKRRHDLIPNLVNTVKGAMEFERDTLAQVMEARGRAVSAVGPADAARKEAQLTQALGRLFAVAESYPVLKANENVRLLQEELAATENRIGGVRASYNDTATRFNTAQQTFPNTMIAGPFGFHPAELFQVADEAERAVPTVDLSMKK
jgi:LemA protein